MMVKEKVLNVNSSLLSLHSSIKECTTRVRTHAHTGHGDAVDKKDRTNAERFLLVEKRSTS